MKVVICCKLVPCSEDVRVTESGIVDSAKARWRISDYDLQALQAGVDVASQVGAKAIALIAGSESITSNTLKKDVLSRGVDELYEIVDESFQYADTRRISHVLAEGVRKIGAELVVCGEGSADRNAQQVGVQLGECLGWASVNAVDHIDVEGKTLKLDRSLEYEIEELELSLPAVLAVTTSINSPSLPGMRSILAAAKKPQVELSGTDFDLGEESSVEVLRTFSPAEPERKNIVFKGDISESALQLVSALKQDGIL